MRCIFMHGLGQNSSNWEDVVNLLTVRPECERPDWVQFLKGKEVTYENLYREFCKYCNKYEGPVNLCGLSLGGLLCLNFAIDHPDKVNSLVLVGTQYKMSDKILKFQSLFLRFMPGSMFDAMGFAKKDYMSLSQTMMKIDFSKDLEKVSCPALVMYGKKDKGSRKPAEELAAGLLDAKLKVIEDSGHEINVDKPEETALALNNFYSFVERHNRRAVR